MDKEPTLYKWAHCSQQKDTGLYSNPHVLSFSRSIKGSLILFLWVCVQLKQLRMFYGPLSTEGPPVRPQGRFSFCSCVLHPRLSLLVVTNLGESAPHLLSCFHVYLLQHHLRAWCSYCSIWLVFCMFVSLEMFLETVLFMRIKVVLERQSSFMDELKEKLHDPNWKYDGDSRLFVVQRSKLNQE